MRPKPAHPEQEDFDFLILLNIISFILYTAETFLKVIVLCIYIYIHTHSPSVSLVLCELLNAMSCLPVVVGLLFFRYSLTLQFLTGMPLVHL